MTRPDYPQTRRDDVAQTLFGEHISDPYRWLEDDVRSSPAVADWVARQNAVTDAYLAGLPARGWFMRRIAQLHDFERFGLPVKAGGRYFYSRNTGLQNQSPLYLAEGLGGDERLLLDPNEWAADGATALSGWKASPDGKKLLYAVQDGGTDWRILRVLDVDTGALLDDELAWVKFTSLAWVGEEGFLYSRFPEPEAGQDFQAVNYDHAVYFHRIGTAQAQDQLVFAAPDHPERSHYAEVTHDGRWAVITSAAGTDAAHEIHVIDLDARGQNGWAPRQLVKGFENAWNLIDAIGTQMWFATNQGAPKFRVMRVDLGAAEPEWSQIVPEADGPIDAASIVGDKLVLSYLEHAVSRAQIHSLEGALQQHVALEGLGTASGFHGKPGDPESFFAFTSFNQPGAIYRIDVSTGQTSIFAQAQVSFDPSDYAVEQHFYPSKDGTRVPMFIVRKASIAQASASAPTLLYGYGGFDVSLTPGFSASRLAWMEAGGAFGLANIRGGGEYGKAWHDAGRRANKQNVFDDFIAAGEYLIAQGITPKDGLAIQGGSNGGLLVGAVVNQRPDLFAAGNAAVGVMDMLRFDRWTAGRYWVDDYGYPDREEDFAILRKYSPLHNIHAGQDYPALIITTADTDDRVVPGHSFKYTAALQAAGLGQRPQLIRIETRAGHGSGKPTDKAIEEAADILAFIAHWTGLKPPVSAD